jgi:hypothetical protein
MLEKLKINKMYIVVGSDHVLTESPVVGCNPCVLRCDVPGSPPIPTTTTQKPLHSEVVKKMKKPSTKTNKKGGKKIKQKSNAGLLAGIVILSFAIVALGFGAVVWYFRFRK